MRPSTLAYYAAPGPLTDLGRHADRVRDLPDGIADLCRVVQGLVVHPFLAHLYGLAPDAVRHDEAELRPVAAMLDRIVALDDRPLGEPRDPERRLVGVCRHFSVLLCAFLRKHGVPARARCGFGAYFDPPRFEDHWVCEAWDESRAGWHLVDPQLDAEQRRALPVAFDPLDVPRTQFLVAADAWERCRRGGDDPQRYGIFDIRGLWFVRGNVVRDLAALTKRELLPWDGWGLMSDPGAEREAELPFVDRLATLTAAPDDAHDELVRVQASDARLRVPRVVTNLRTNVPVDLGPGIAD